MKKFIAIFSAFLFIIAMPQQAARAHGGDSGVVDKCTQSVGNAYNMHMTSYIPDDRGGREFCGDIPSAGRVIVVFDMLEAHLRHHETDVRIIKDLGPDTDIKTNTIFHMPFAKIKSGSLYFDHTYQDKGKYIGIVSVRDHDKTHITKFPYTVGFGPQKKVQKSFGTAIILLIASLAFFVIYRVRARRKKTNPATPA